MRLLYYKVTTAYACLMLTLIAVLLLRQGGLL